MYKGILAVNSIYLLPNMRLKEVKIEDQSINLLFTFFIIEITVQEVLESLEVLMEAGMHHLDVNHLWRALLSPLLQAHPQAQRQQNPQAEIQTGKAHSRLYLGFQKICKCIFFLIKSN